MCFGYIEADPAISRHGEPHVVRVGVERVLWMGKDQKILDICGVPNYSEDAEIMVRPLIGSSTPQPSLDEHLPGTGGDRCRDGEVESASSSKIYYSKLGVCHWSPKVWAVG